MRRRRPARLLAASGSVLALVAGLAACGGGADEATENTPQRLVIGVSSTQPGLGVDQDGEWSGFEVDLARYLADGLGFEASEVVFTSVVPANREQMLEGGEVDMVLAQYPVPQPGAAGTGDSGEGVDPTETAPDDQDDADEADEGGDGDDETSPTDDPEPPVVEFSTPYFTAHQDLLVERQDTAITDLGAIDDPDRVLCSVTGSGKAQRVKDDYAPQVDLQEFDSYGLCVEALLEGRIDAVTTDDIVLAGYAEQHPEQLRVVGSLYAPEDYAVGLPVGSPYRDRVDQLIRSSIDDGTWERLLTRDLGNAGWDLPDPPAQTP